ncbi:uncharacterized protein KQ657_004844 [Scheffersomyces spartinae]|uniref:Cystathionine gamma-synthase n=1 Tax=Scheffersomyces spartinae TaxID=45513 RepID=A0A9P7VAQ5_9ASCO|nr:uncharacterized protein KQ657_004844 [Scheffersomyces spartinae]KAG7194136.1 hypothetical protein KQ657_004844 [Scheffersomyces spartinae]
MTGISTNLIHGGDKYARVHDVAPPINILTTFSYPLDSSKLVKASDAGDFNVDEIVYSRLSHPNGLMAEAAISTLTGGNVVLYASGLAAFLALITHVNPKRLAIGKAYHGVHGISKIWERNHGLEILDLYDSASIDKLQPGDLVHLETPLNPTGEHYDIQYYTDLAHSKGAVILIDSTFSPPPLQDPFVFGVDFVMHSATKYFGGHSDLLAGMLITKDTNVYQKLVEDRVYLGSNIANLESSLLLRSLKTFELRVLKQSENASKIVAFLDSNRDKFKVLIKIYHGSLQKEPFVTKQAINGYHSPVFSIDLKDEETAKLFPSKLKYFHHATSLGGVESLIEWRALSDEHAAPTLLRVSVGVENVDDLIADIEQALLAAEVETINGKLNLVGV